MAKTVKETLEEMTATKKNSSGKIVINRFNKKNFTKLMTAMANDVDFKAEVAKAKNGELDSVEEILVTKEFRKWCKNLLEKAGVDKNESVRILDGEFQIPSMDGLYEFFATALYTYIDAGNQFDMLPTNDFKGSIYMKSVDEKTTVTEAHSPKDRSYLGTFKTTKKKHKEIAVKSGCPKWLAKRYKVDK